MWLLVFCIASIVLVTTSLLMYVLLSQWSETCHQYVDAHIAAFAARTTSHQKVLLDHDTRVNVVESIMEELLLLSKSNIKAMKRLDTINLDV